MDSNLEKIRDVNLNDIKKGRLSTVLRHAEDYLYTITDPMTAAYELSQFVKHIRILSKNQ